MSWSGKIFCLNAHFPEPYQKCVDIGGDVFYLLVMNDAFKAEIKRSSYIKNDSRLPGNTIDKGRARWALSSAK